MRVRCRIVLCAIAAGLLVAAVAHGAADLHTDALVAVPALLLLLPLAAGRYVGAERLARLVREVPRPRRRDGARAVPRRRPAPRPHPRGGPPLPASPAPRAPPPGAGPRRRDGARAVPRRRPALRPNPRGGLLIAVSLARRGPPVSAAAR